MELSDRKTGSGGLKGWVGNGTQLGIGSTVMKVVTAIKKLC